MVAGADVRTRAIVIQQMTHRPVQFELTGDVRAALLAWLERRRGSISDYLFPSRIDAAACSRQQAESALPPTLVICLLVEGTRYGPVRCGVSLDRNTLRVHEGANGSAQLRD